MAYTITGDQDFKFDKVLIAGGAQHTASFIYSGAHDGVTGLQGLLASRGAYAVESAKRSRSLPSIITGYYDYVASRLPPISGVPQRGRVSKKNRPDDKYTLVATGFRHNSGIYETPHGISYNKTNWATNAGITGDYNFYMAFYGPGYYQPRAGELFTFAENQVGFVRTNSAVIDDLNQTEALKVFGLRLIPRMNKLQSVLPCKGYGQLSIIHEGSSDCPNSAKKDYKFEELFLELTAGTFNGGIGGNIYNHNPLPSAYDRGVFVSNTSHSTVVFKHNPPPQDGDAEECRYSSPMKATFDIRSMVNAAPASLNSNTAGQASDQKVQALLGGGQIEGNGAAFSVCYRGADGVDSSSQSYDASNLSTLHSTSNLTDQSSLPLDMSNNSSASQNFYWHYAFRNNNYVLPFNNTSEAHEMLKAGSNNGANEEHWWNYRECPEGVSHLNHAFGNNINACPSNYLDVPYYASIGKFGFFGTRFQDTWRYVQNDALLLDDIIVSGDSGPTAHPDQKYADYPITNPVSGANPILDTSEKYEPRGMAYGAIPTDSDYDELIKKAVVEKNHRSFDISDRALFLRLNYKAIVTFSDEYNKLKALDGSFAKNFKSFLVRSHDPTGLTSFNFSMKQATATFVKDDPLEIFTETCADRNLFETLVKKYGYVKIKDAGPEVTSQANLLAGSSVDTDWYNALINRKTTRIGREYYRNIAKGKPVDLFPENIITFSSEKASDFSRGDFLKYSSVPRSVNLKNTQSTIAAERNTFQEVPSTDMRYFHTAFSNAAEQGLFNAVNNIFIPQRNIYGGSPPTATSNISKQTQSFYLGYLNPRGCERETPKSSYGFLRIMNLPGTGIFEHFAPETDPPPSVNTASPTRLMNDTMDSYDKNFSCFSPIFLQQPINTLTKSYLPPTFRVFAVDYHGIPEDKIIENKKVKGFGRPEIGYWLRKIKAIDKKGESFYPLKYQWYRILNTNIPEYLENKKESLLEVSDPSPVGISPWCALEGGRTPECTVVIKALCKDLAGAQATFPNSEENLSVCAGPNKAEAELYHYFCRVTGRFGWRDSEMAKITCESTIEVEFATLDLAGGGGSFGFLGKSVAIKGGMRHDAGAHIEDVVDKLWNNNNDCESWRFVGNELLGGYTRVWTPSHMTDSRGKKIRSDAWTDFGELSKVTVDNEDFCLNFYAKRALPYCDVGRQATYAGSPLTSPSLKHRTAADTPVLTHNSRVGLIAPKMKSIGDLYVPSSFYGKPALGKERKYPLEGQDFDASIQPAHFQFENNLGLIKNFSRNHNDKSVKVIGGAVSEAQNLIDIVKNKIFNVAGGSRILSGPECGYVAPSFGRLMHFYVETFDTFFSICPPWPKKKVRNWSFIAGGLRSDYAGLQFSWLGKPRNARLKRQSLPGPYGFEWKVQRHNRDRNGNGMSLGFWSYYWEDQIKNMYDAAAVLGALKRMMPPTADRIKERVRNRNLRIFAAMAQGFNGSPKDWAMGQRFGPDLGPKLGCGDTRIKIVSEEYVDADPDSPTYGNTIPAVYKPNKEVYMYASLARGNPSLDLSSFGCTDVKASDCFFPCVSLKWPNGFSPKGKQLKAVNDVGQTITTCADCDETPVNTTTDGSGRKAKIHRKKISACGDGHRDTCNYITPTVHLGIDTFLGGSAAGGAKIASAAKAT